MAKDAGWREALAFEGSTYVGLIGKILDDLPLADAEPCWNFTYSGRGLIVPGRLLVVYRSTGVGFDVIRRDVPRDYRIIDPTTGATLRRGRLDETGRANVDHPYGKPAVFIFEAGV